MIKTLSKAQKMEREKFRIPRSVQDAIPVRRIFADGIFQVGNQYSKTWSFTDINYAIASKEDKTSMFLDYSELLNALDSGASAKITIYNRRINKAEFEHSVLLPDKDDGLNEYRHEFNQMLTAQVTGTSNSIVRERYLTVSVVKRNPDEARSYFARVGTDLVTHLAQLSSVATELTLNERLHIFRDFFKAGEQAAAEFNIHEHAKRGQHFKDWLCPDSMEFAADHFKLDARYGRVLYLQDYASYIKDSFVSELCDLDRDLMLSIDILPVPTDEAARQLQSTLLGIETNVTNWQRRQNANNNFTATVPYDMELQRKETKEMLFFAADDHGVTVAPAVAAQRAGGAEIPHRVDGKGAAIRPGDGAGLHIPGGVKLRGDFYIHPLRGGPLGGAAFGGIQSVHGGLPKIINNQRLLKLAFMIAQTTARCKRAFGLSDLKVRRMT